ncbi:MAG TPA: transcriptional regulator [Acidobacteriaceae bacterium]|nr:transcriptional regulator [Acidobacteriaceae bacterium]
MRTAPNITGVFNALGDSTRHSIVEPVSKGPVSVSDLAKPFNMSLAAVVQHVTGARDRRPGPHKKIRPFTNLLPQAKCVDLATSCITNRKSLWSSRLDTLGALLDEEN